MSENSVSIIAPAFNHENYIRKCLESIANQNIPQMQLIIIDDVSRDNTCKVIEELIQDKDFSSKFDNGITFLKHDVNKGAFYTLNEGLRMANGKYLAMVNTDDYYGENRLKLLLSACESDDTEFAFGGINVVDQNDQAIMSGYGKEIMKYQYLIEKCPTVSMALARGNSTISTGNMIFSRKLYEQLKGFGNYKYVHDWDFALRASLVTEPSYVNDAKYYYRIHTGNTIAEISQEHKNPDALEKPEDGKTIGINPLVMYFINIMNGKYTNKKIPPLEAWEYFVNFKKYYYDDDTIVWAWESAKKLKEMYC